MCTLYEGQKPVVSTVTVKSMVKGLSAACSRFHSSKFCCLSRASCKSVTMPSICTAVSITVQHSWLTVETGEVTEFEPDLAQPSCELCASLLNSAAFSKAASVKCKQAAKAFSTSDHAYNPTRSACWPLLSTCTLTTMNLTEASQHMYTSLPQCSRSVSLL